MWTVIELSGGDLGGETIRLRADLSRTDRGIEVDYREGSGWHPTQYQTADTSHRVAGLADLGKRLAAAAVEMPVETFECSWREVPESEWIESVIVWICGNAESICDGICDTDSEMADEYVNAAMRVLDGHRWADARISRHFSDWHGGRFDQFWRRCGLVAVPRDASDLVVRVANEADDAGQEAVQQAAKWRQSARGRRVVISRDGVWCGDGRLTADGEIVDCPAVLGADQEASDETYEELAEALRDGDGIGPVTVERPDGDYTVVTE